VGGRVAAASRVLRETTVLWQCVCVCLLQRFNAILVGETFVDANKAPGVYLLHALLLVSDFSPLVLYTLGH